MRALVFVLAAPLLAQSQDAELFERSVRPIFAAKCAACHGAKAQMGGLNLQSGAGIEGVVLKNDALQSRLYQALTYKDKVKMPPSGKLSDEEIAAVRAWIEQGGAWPKPATARISGITEEDRKHWAFRAVTRPGVPSVKQQAWVRNPIDAFILAGLETKGLKPAAPASKATLLRRLTYDLTGLPPSVEEIQSFLADSSPNALEKVVDRLLASPRYGERWGRHWLDVARYADSTGMDEDNLYPHAWRYRDYVVKAFNDDLPFDRFIQEQIAGDLLPQRNVVATGFLALGPKPLAQQDRLQMIYDVVDEQIDTVSKAFMGLTVACARCHDHKFDPILTRDYYSMASIFASTTSFRNHGRPGAISYFHQSPLDQAAYDRYQTHRVQTLAKQLEMEDALSEHLGRENAVLRPRVGDALVAAWQVIHKGADLESVEGVDSRQLKRWVDWLKGADSKAREGYLKAWMEATGETIAQVAAGYQEAYSASAKKWDESLSRWRSRMAIEALQERALPDRPKPDAEEHAFFAASTFNGGPMEVPESARVQLLRAEWKLLESTMPEMPEVAIAVTDGAMVDQRIFVRGNLHNPGEPVAKQFPIVLAGDAQSPVAKGSGRLELAQWLTGERHPLTARVTVNRIWQWHFGEAIVRTPNNWGRTGEKPTHPELLDYLASEFVGNGWSVKKLHRLILLSNTYQMGTQASTAAKEADPTNRLWSRFNRLRMSVEQIRDSFLAIDGSLDPAIGGTLLQEGKGKRQKVDMDEINRRTLYFPVRRGSIPNLLNTFDFGDATTASEGRTRTNVAPQALFMLNSKFVIDHSKRFAERLLAGGGTDAERIQTAYLTALGRKPEPAEVDEALSYVSSMEKRLSGADVRAAAWQSFCHVLLSTNEFLYLN